MNVDECFKKRILRKIQPDIKKAKRSIEIAENKLEIAKKSFKKELYGPTIIYGYTSMFHSSRALLFKDGIKERSHLCIVIYLKEKYPRLRKHANTLDFYRRSRHSVIYGLDIFIAEDQAKEAIKTAEKFIDEIRKEMKQRN